MQSWIGASVRPGIASLPVNSFKRSHKHHGAWSRPSSPRSASPACAQANEGLANEFSLSINYFLHFKLHPQTTGDCWTETLYFQSARGGSERGVGKLKSEETWALSEDVKLRWQWSERQWAAVRYLKSGRIPLIWTERRVILGEDLIGAAQFMVLNQYSLQHTCPHMSV